MIKLNKDPKRPNSEAIGLAAFLPIRLHRPGLHETKVRNLAHMEIFFSFIITFSCMKSLHPGEQNTKSLHNSIKPSVISVMIGGNEKQSHEITYDGRELHYYSAENFFKLKTAKPVVIKPTNEQWQEFFDELERLNVWKWNHNFDKPGIADGMVWRAFVIYSTHDSRFLVSAGSNAYPTDFKAFLTAVRKLIGDRPFE